MPFHENDAEDLERAKPFIIGIAALLFFLRLPTHGPQSALGQAESLWNAWYEEFKQEA